MDPLLERIDKIVTFFLQEMNEMGVEEVTVSKSLFEQALHYAFHGKDGRLFLHSEQKEPPIDSFTMNIYGRPVLIKRGKKNDHKTA